ncbi:mismatch-specific DNA-glycosylase [Hyphomicrobium sp. D-2]|uniref:mismatch-specific DNA-glycosylase n=1 Tax=Hyphomicrobium sp. D-2 TaxID=3041621 RepID=UPI0024554179|nr:mismatch-specific DNA-glycosylase [Hyphomicrobium sp. D-2]MDH4982662.1 mismatch-specific DNA-glycosylase [Hyphomicrobium sp. D-2]
MTDGHKLPDVLSTDLDIVFVGTAAGKESAERGEYYAGAGNRFWQTLHEVGLTPRRFRPDEFHELRSLRMGLTDLSKFESGTDGEIRHFDLEHFAQNIVRYRPRAIAFTGKKAAAIALGKDGTDQVAYGRQPARDGFPEVFVLTSTSAAARSHWDIAPWAALADWHAATRSIPG